MNKHIAFLAVIAVASSAYGLDRPDGNLGTDFFCLSGKYMNADSTRGKDVNYDYIGPGMTVNKHVYQQGDVGVDLSFDFGLIKNQNMTGVYDLSDYDYAFSATVFRKGLFSPYFKMTADYEKFELDYKNASIPDVDNDTLNLGGEIGVECHLMPGWSVTPYLSEFADTDADEDQWTWAAGVSTCYWVNSLIGVRLTGEYSNHDDADSFVASIGAACHF